MYWPTLLCVDDGKLSLVVRKLVLEEAGYTVLTATDTALALGFLRKKHIDLVICDHLLHGEKGTEFAAHIKFLKPTVPIILLSGSIEVPDKPANVDVYVSKADGPEVLL